MWVDGPVDFSDLSSEYIGILYEGLLDFELRCEHRASSRHPAHQRQADGAVADAMEGCGAV
jgi:hypothetical protein